MDGRLAYEKTLRLAASIALALGSCSLVGCNKAEKEPSEGLEQDAARAIGARLGMLAQEKVAAAEKDAGSCPASKESGQPQKMPAADEPGAQGQKADAVEPEPDSQPGSEPQPQAQRVRVSGPCSMVFEVINEYRAQVGAPALALDARLCQAAQARAEEMAAAKRCGHTRPDGSDCFTVLGQFGVSFGIAGENVADGFASAREVCEAFRASQDHYENMVSSAFSKVGVGLAKSSNGICYWAQLFSG